MRKTMQSRVARASSPPDRWPQAMRLLMPSCPLAGPHLVLRAHPRPAPKRVMCYRCRRSRQSSSQTATLVRSRMDLQMQAQPGTSRMSWLPCVSGCSSSTFCPRLMPERVCLLIVREQALPRCSARKLGGKTLAAREGVRRTRHGHETLHRLRALAIARCAGTAVASCSFSSTFHSACCHTPAAACQSKCSSKSFFFARARAAF